MLQRAKHVLLTSKDPEREARHHNTAADIRLAPFPLDLDPVGKDQQVQSSNRRGVTAPQTESLAGKLRRYTHARRTPRD
jgi:hypothetical protein